MRFNSPHFLVLTLALFTLTSTQTLSQSPGTQALRYTSATGFGNGGFPVMGWSFTTNQAITVSALGALRPGSSSAVRLYDGTGTVLASATVSNSDPINGNSGSSARMHAITPIQLAANTTYYIVQEAAAFGFDGQAAGITTIPSISFGAMIASGTPGANPTTDELFGLAYNPGAFGPNFETPTPSISKTFGAQTIPLGGTTSLTFEVKNPNPFAAMTGVSFTDTLPTGLTVATANGLTGTCGGGTITATAGSDTISLAGATLAANGTCTFSVNVTGTTLGNKKNSVTVTSTNGGTGNTATATLEVNSLAMLDVLAGDPAVCLDANGLVGVTATLTNGNALPANATFTATLPVGLTAIAGTCAADVSPANCAIAANGGSVTWNGQLNAGQTVTIIYRARLAATVGQGAQLTITNQAVVAGAPLNFNAVVNVNCPALVNTRVSDQKAGSLLVFPYYTSTIGGASDTRLTISNISNAAGTLANQTYVHLFLIDGTSCQQADFYLCLTPNASFSFKASEYDPGNTGYVIAVAVNAQGVPIQNNVLIGNAFVNTPEFADNYGAESFYANSTAVATVSGNTATLWFDQVGYDALPRQFAVEIQSPLDAPGQQIVTAGLIGDMTIGPLVGAAQVGTGQAFNEQEKFVSFNNWLTGSCQARATISTTNPRVPNGLGNLIKSGQAGSMKFNVMGAVGLLMTPRTATWRGIRTLHKTQTVGGVLTIPLFTPVC